MGFYPFISFFMTNFSFVKCLDDKYLYFCTFRISNFSLFNGNLFISGAMCIACFWCFFYIYKLAYVKQMYLDIDECKIKSEGTSCTSSSACKNTVGGFVCECLPGYSQVGLLSNKTVCIGKFYFLFYCFIYKFVLLLRVKMVRGKIKAIFYNLYTLQIILRH